MKKTITLLTMIALSLQAQSNINVGANQITINDQTGTGFNVGYGATGTMNNGILGGFDFNYDQATVEEETVNSISGDFKLGYKYKDLAIYGIGSVISQAYQETEAYGFGTGAGISYDLFEHMGVAADYKSYSMTTELTEYDFDTVKVYLKIIF